MQPQTAIDKRVRLIPTPEGITIPFKIATAGDRVGAFLIDLVIMAVATFIVWVVAAFSLVTGGGALAFSIALIFSFVLRNFYFIISELKWGGRTIGKRILGLRVISRNGGPLTTEAIFARNLTRDLEFFLPLTALIAPGALFGEGPGWMKLLGGAWLFVFLLMPLFNRDRLRVGDIVGGTMVVRAPVAVLLPDLAGRNAEFQSQTPKQPDQPDDVPAERFVFTQEQLDIYGIHELQTLEDLLRRYEERTLDFQVLEQVCEKIKVKVAWPQHQWNVPVLEFLQAFYRAQRGRLERKMLFGKRQERKKY